MNYFLDTYSLIELAKGNKKFEGFLQKQLFTSIFNLYELYFILLKDFNEEIAKEFFYSFKSIVLMVRDEHIFKASRFKLDKVKKGLSYADCLGYVMALEYGLRFLTGDKEFENLDNVEFVKK